MKKKEKIVILILIVLTIALVVAGRMIKTEETGEGKEEADKVDAETLVTVAGADDESIKGIEENVANLEDGTKLNISETLNETKTNLDGIEINNIQLTEKNNSSLLLATVTNVSDETKGGYFVNVTFKAKNGDELVTVGAYIPELEAGESTQLNTGGTFDCANAYDFEITKV